MVSVIIYVSLINRLINLLKWLINQNNCDTSPMNADSDACGVGLARRLPTANMFLTLLAQCALDQVYWNGIVTHVCMLFFKLLRFCTFGVRLQSEVNVRPKRRTRWQSSHCESFKLSCDHSQHSSWLAVRLTLRVREALGAAVLHLFYATTIIGQDVYSGGLRSIKQDRRMSVW